MSSTLASTVTIRRLRAADSLAELTELLHRAYGPLATAGLNYTACDQDEATTRRRCGRGECFVAQVNGGLIGTVTLVRGPVKGSQWLGRPDVASFYQFAVDPKLQRQGIGLRLLHTVEGRAAEVGFRHLALHTAECADHLIRWYTALGFQFVEHLRGTAFNGM